MKTITIVVLGEMHRDVAPAWLMQRALASLQAAKIPVVVCDEHCSDNTIDMTRALNRGCISANETVFDRLPHIKAGQKRLPGSAYHYYTVADIPAIETCIRAALSNLDAQKIHACALQLTRHNQCVAQNDLLGDLKNNSIPYFGIDYPNQQKTALVTRFSANKQVWVDEESKRARYMADRLFNNVMPALSETGGVIFVSVGMLHVHRLTANLLQRLAQQRSTSSMQALNVVIQPRYISSPLVEDNREHMLASVHQHDDIDTQALRAWYPCIPIPEIRSTCGQERELHSEDFTKLTQALIDSWQQMPVKIWVPQLDAHKRRVCALIGARVLDSDAATRDSTLSAIEVLPQWVLKPIRDKLGIETRLMRFNDHRHQRLDYLKTIFGVTLLPTDEPDRFRVTFPISAFAQVKLSVLAWDAFVAASEAKATRDTTTALALLPTTTTIAGGSVAGAAAAVNVGVATEDAVDSETADTAVGEAMFAGVQPAAPSPAGTGTR